MIVWTDTVIDYPRDLSCTTSWFREFHYSSILYHAALYEIAIEVNGSPESFGLKTGLGLGLWVRPFN